MLLNIYNFKAFTTDDIRKGFFYNEMEHFLMLQRKLEKNEYSSTNKDNKDKLKERICNVKKWRTELYILFSAQMFYG